MIDMHKKNSGSFQSGHSPWNKNLKGIHLSSESEFKKGCNGNWKGRKHKDESIDIMSMKNKGKHSSVDTEFKKGHIPFIKGKRFSEIIDHEINEERKSKIKLTMKDIWTDDKWKELQLKKMVKGLWKRPTSLEKKMIELIKVNNLNYKYCGDGSVILNGKCPDFINCNGQKIVLETANRYHHQNNYEESRKNVFSQIGFRTLVFWEEDFKNPELIISKIKTEEANNYEKEKIDSPPKGVL